MLYNEELAERRDKKPSDTNIFGTNILLTLGVKIIGKDVTKWFSAFKNLDSLISFKQKMRQPPAGNVPITITKINNIIKISGRLAKPKDAGNIAHDPSIGSLSMISSCIRKLGWKGEIEITRHGVTQRYINNTHGQNKFLYICKLLSLKMEGLTLPSNIMLPQQYWHYERSSEKVASILLHEIALYGNTHTVYENHAGSERGYFRNKNGLLITLPKKDLNNENLYLPDCVLYDKSTNHILLIEGKKLDTLQDGLREIHLYDSIEKEYIIPNYPGAKITRCLSIFGGDLNEIPNTNVIFYVNKNGHIFFNKKLTPQFIFEPYKAINLIEK